MSLVNSQSPLTVLAPFELFSNAPVQTSIENIHREQIRPITQLNTGGYIEFDVNSNLNEYIKLEEIYLTVKFRVKLTKTDKSTVALSDWDSVSTVNNVLHSLFNQVDLSINDIQTTISLLTYAHKAYFNELLFSTPEARKSYLQCGGWYVDDEPTHYNRSLSKERTKLIEHIKQTEYKKAKRIAELSVPPAQVPATPTAADADVGRIVELSGRLHLDLLNQNKYLIGGTKLHFKFVLNRPEFLFMVKDEKLYPQINFLDVYLDVPKAIVSDDLAIAHQKAIVISPAKYPIDRFEVRTMTIDTGVTGKTFENVINGRLPKKIFVTFVENQSFNGSFTENPFLYKHFDIAYVACFVNGVRKIIQTDFSNRLILEAYLELCKVPNQANNSNRMQINMRDFENGSTIWAFNINQDGSDGVTTDGHTCPPLDGHIRFEILFRTPTTKPINALFFCDFDNQICVTSDRNPIVDY